MMKEKPKVLKVKTYSIKVTEYDNDVTNLRRRNNGFNSFELIGLMDLIARENAQTWSDSLREKLTNIDRVVVVEKKK